LVGVQHLCQKVEFAFLPHDCLNSTAIKTRRIIMVQKIDSQSTVVRTSRGLSIAGTRITLYNVMDYLKAGWQPKLIQDWLNLSDTQIAEVMDYIATHKDEVETEYQEVIKTAEENRKYWEERNRERFAKIAKMPPKPGQEKVRAKLQAAKERLGMA
jgi:uncharacterized protein (DUF433 family)